MQELQAKVMPRNHYICQGYLRGFSTWDESAEQHMIESCDPAGNVTTTTIYDVCCEDAPAEPSIELVRKEAENWWGKFRTAIRTHLHLDSNRGQREKVAEFVATTIMLTRMGRAVVRSETDNQFNSKSEFEATKILIAARQLKENFLKLRWMLLKPRYNLLTSDSPACWKTDDDLAHVVKAMFFPLTCEYLLCLSNREENVGFIEDDESRPECEKLSFASICAIASNLQLIRGAREQNAKLYAPVGYDWKTALGIERVLP